MRSAALQRVFHPNYGRFGGGTIRRHTLDDSAAVRFGGSLVYLYIRVITIYVLMITPRKLPFVLIIEDVGRDSL